MNNNSEKHISNYCPEERFIIEISANSVNLIAQLLHIYNLCQKETKIGKTTLQALIEQTSCAFASPEIHGVYENGLRAPSQCDVMKPIYYLSYE